ncbi:MAG TPA: pitrilysin family protein [Gammaproteobacteria bacterium]|nr:pitrilysin family protein [Gammaproteobacteria bacterium]
MTRTSSPTAARLVSTLLLVCATLIPGARTLAQEAHDVNGIIPFPTTTKKLDNGLTVIVMPMPSKGLATFWSIARTGSRDEYEPGHSGFAHFFEHMMFHGTERYPAERYLQTMVGIGANMNAYTTDDHTAYHVSMAAEDLEKVIELESDRIQNLSYTESAFQTEAGAVYGEYRKSRTDPHFALEESLMATAFEKHTYGHTTMGFERDIAAMPKMYDYSRSFFARYYRPENTVLFVVGDVDPERVLPLVERYYGGWKRGYVAPQIPVEPEQRGERHVDVRFDGQTLPIVDIAYKLPAFAPADRTRVAADLLAELSFGETSETHKRLVLDEQVVEYVDAGADDSRDPKLFEIQARVKDPAKIDYVLGVLDATIAAARESPPDAARLAALKQRLKYGFVMGLSTPDSVANRLAYYIALSGDLEGVRTLYATYADLTPEDVQRAAQSYFAAARRTVGVLRARE